MCNKVFYYTGIVFAIFISSCSKSDKPAPNPPDTTNPSSFNFTAFRLNGQFNGYTYYNINLKPVFKVSFSAPVSRSAVASSFSLKNSAGANVNLDASYENGDSTVVVQPGNTLSFLEKYIFSVSTALKSVSGSGLLSGVTATVYTQLDSSQKFSSITDAELLTKVQQQTFKYFWDYGHPVSGLARERSNGDDNTVTSGGSGFGIMGIPVAVSRGFITRDEALTRMQTIVSFLKNTAQTFHGAFPHWLNGSTGAVIPFSQADNGADLVETSYLMAGLLAARQYFNNAGAAETNLRNDINILYNNVEWDWFRNAGQNVLYWHWSPNYNWQMNLPIRGWNECLITYILAASSITHSVPLPVYSNGWAGGSSFANGNTYYGYTLPLGPAYGGPLFFSHYSFLGINPNGLQDMYANYQTQTTNHTLINHAYCVANPDNYFGYSADCWGLTASDIQNGYTASSPANDVGVIAPTAALSSFPYTPAESMKALKFFYYILGDKIWQQYGFTDAFSLKDRWFANSFLAIDQGPIIIMIENYRTGLIWNLLTSCPEIQNGMRTLGFTAPYL